MTILKTMTMYDHVCKKKTRIFIHPRKEKILKNVEKLLKNAWKQQFAEINKIRETKETCIVSTRWTLGIAFTAFYILIGSLNLGHLGSLSTQVF